jgi:TolB-like protein/DNA-binding winged helix-turn-helix (wHTH) protein/Flp pilus assembly protein TadD
VNERLTVLKPVGPASLADEEDFRLGDIWVRPSLREVEANGARESLEPRVMQVLVALARANGAVLSRDELIRQCWGGRIVGEDAINRCVSKIRQLAELGGGEAFEIDTIPRVGYRLIEHRTNIAPAAAVATSSETTRAPESSSRARHALAAAFFFLVIAALAAFLFFHWQVSETFNHVATGQRANNTKPSIAVLPFRNLSTSADTGYFAEGIQDEILTRLAKIGSLKVISRTSTEPYAGKTQNLKQIARQIGVDNVLEGNVQREGNRVRINVQLIRASNDSHLWAEDYDRTLEDVFSVESEVARSIATTLAAHLTGSELRLLNTRPTSNAKAYDFYLRGLVWMGKPLEPGAPEKAAAALEQAVRADPGFALAWSKLSVADAFLAFGGDAKRLEPARHALQRAEALGPQLPETQVASAFLKYYGESDYRGALKDFEALHRKWPNNVEVLRALGLLSRRVGRAQDAVAYFREAMTLDPHNLIHYTAVIDILDGMHRFPEALQVVDKALAIWPDNPELLSWKAGVLMDAGQMAAAGAVLASIPESARLEVIGLFTAQYMFERRYADGARYLEKTLAAHRSGMAMETAAHLLMQTGDLEARAGDIDAARKNLTKARNLWLKLLSTAPRDTGILQPLAYTCRPERPTGSHYDRRPLHGGLSALARQHRGR